MLLSSRWERDELRDGDRMGFDEAEDLLLSLDNLTFLTCLPVEISPLAPCLSSNVNMCHSCALVNCCDGGLIKAEI